jgi:hypothetical protein
MKPTRLAAVKVLWRRWSEWIWMTYSASLGDIFGGGGGGGFSWLRWIFGGGGQRRERRICAYAVSLTLEIAAEWRGEKSQSKNASSRGGFHKTRTTCKGSGQIARIQNTILGRMQNQCNLYSMVVVLDRF